jgi:hypothetical protein
MTNTPFRTAVERLFIRAGLHRPRCSHESCVGAGGSGRRTTPLWPRRRTTYRVAGPVLGDVESRATSHLLRPPGTTAVMTSCAFDLADLPNVKRCQPCREKAANCVVKPDTAHATNHRRCLSRLLAVSSAPMWPSKSPARSWPQECAIARARAPRGRCPRPAPSAWRAAARSRPRRVRRAPRAPASRCPETDAC